MDQYMSHTIHCRSCSAALRRFGLPVRGLGLLGDPLFLWA